jgi:hypothetical protein
MTDELLLSLVVNAKPTPSPKISSEPTFEKTDVHMAYAEQHRFDGYAQIVDRAHHRKAALNKGDLMQVYPSDLNYTFKNREKALTQILCAPTSHQQGQSPLQI